jgi:hypothetical protein
MAKVFSLRRGEGLAKSTQEERWGIAPEAYHPKLGADLSPILRHH